MNLFSKLVAGWMILLAAAVVAGCSSAHESAAGATTSATPVANSSAARAAAAKLPGDDEILRQIDEALEYTFERRRLSVGSTTNDQAAWQIIHGALAYKREFLVNDGTR